MMQQEAGNEMNEEPEAGYSAVEYSRLVDVIGDLEPANQLAVLNRAEVHVHDLEVKSLHDATVKYVKAQLSGEINRYSIQHNFNLIWKKNPVLVGLACAAFAMLIFKFGYSVTSIVKTVNAGGFWGNN